MENSSRSEILKQELTGLGYDVEQVFYKNNFPKKNFGWFAIINESVYYLGTKFSKALYNIHNKQIKPAQ